jgi:hypothetical protein
LNFAKVSRSFGPIMRDRLYAAALLTLSLLTISCDITGGCSDTIITESRSPNGQLVATVFERDCGATTAKNIQICLRLQSVPFGRKEPQSFLVFEGDTNVTVSWSGNDTLTVTLPPSAEIFRRDERQTGVSIRYLEKKNE